MHRIFLVNPTPQLDVSATKNIGQFRWNVKASIIKETTKCRFISSTISMGDLVVHRSYQSITIHPILLVNPFPQLNVSATKGIRQFQWNARQAPLKRQQSAKFISSTTDGGCSCCRNIEIKKIYRKLKNTSYILWGKNCNKKAMLRQTLRTVKYIQHIVSLNE